LVTEKGRYIGKYGIRPADLENDLKYLKDNGYTTVVMRDLIRFVEKGKSLPDKPIVLTFDDGNASDYDYLFPLLKKYDMKAVLCVMGKATDDCTRDTDKYPTARYPNLTWPQIKEMHDSGYVEIQSHGYNVHTKPVGSGKLNRESDAQYHARLLADLRKFQDSCQQHLDYMPNTFCYPLGVIAKGSQAVLEELGFVASLSCQEGINTLKHGDMGGLFKLNRNNRPAGRGVESVLGDILK